MTVSLFKRPVAKAKRVHRETTVADQWQAAINHDERCRSIVEQSIDNLELGAN